MFIVWGRKIQRKFVGRRPGYCPVCRVLKPFRIEEIVSVGHLYYIPLGSRKTEAVVRICEGCRQAFQADEEDLSGSVRDRRASLDELVEATGLASRDAARLEIEERVRAKRLTPGERETLLLEPFRIVATDVEQRKGSMHIDPVSGTLLVLTIALTGGWMVLVNQPPVSTWVDADRALAIGLGIFAVTGIAMLASFAGDVRRYCRRVALPKLVRALHPLDPTEAELEHGLATCRHNKLALGKHLKAGQIREALEVHIPDSH